jgi:ferredoxin
LFEADEYGYVSPIGDGTVPPELEEVAQLAADNCPEWAIDLTAD